MWRSVKRPEKVEHIVCLSSGWRAQVAMPPTAEARLQSHMPPGLEVTGFVSAYAFALLYAIGMRHCGFKAGHECVASDEYSGAFFRANVFRGAPINLT